MTLQLPADLHHALTQAITPALEHAYPGVQTMAAQWFGDAMPGLLLGIGIAAIWLWRLDAKSEDDPADLSQRARVQHPLQQLLSPFLIVWGGIAAFTGAFTYFFHSYFAFYFYDYGIISVALLFGGLILFGIGLSMEFAGCHEPPG
ncbi:hypothetical protein [Acidihalobacter ferrooxydans]|uniref:Uncharacterized protein n=1 Tax=Acidihalobacter ferrooxydans TaxID=1765967 RepID=A0A1P8UF38_9GAMM|nr:hypothetical protein [Acidihalobacter ferrooxydans]APZ42436.1 hypothetical protein BW247_04485 [Acidihalobacter ferrooxydans]